MENKINAHVDRLHRYLPFSLTYDQIYEEYQTSDDSMNLSTVALKYLLEAVRSNTKLIILTGDAGYGKTHLWGRLLEEHLGYSQNEARSYINSECDGSTQIIKAGGDNLCLLLRILRAFQKWWCKGLQMP